MKVFSIFTILVCCFLCGCGAVNPFSSSNEIKMSEIVDDTVNGGKRYEKEEITLKATVEHSNIWFLFLGSITLETGRTDVDFFVIDPEDPRSLDKYEDGETYTFKLYIREIEIDTDDGGWNIWAKEI